MLCHVSADKAFVMKQAVPLNNRERHSHKMLWVELFLVGLERPATLSESRDVSMLDRILLRGSMCEAIS